VTSTASIFGRLWKSIPGALTTNGNAVSKLMALRPGRPAPFLPPRRHSRGSRSMKLGGSLPRSARADCYDGLNPALPG
jgi:hypothetical protein